VTARRAALLALYWTAVLLTAALVDLAAGLPFTGPAASLAGDVAAAGVCLIGLASAPTLNTRKGGA
jgi:hypothetical protein